VDKDLEAKLYAAALHQITTLHFERLNTEQRAHLADAIVREIKLRHLFEHGTRDDENQVTPFDEQQS